MKIENSPCFGCQRRYGGCHAVCKEGLEYEADLKEKNQAIKAERDKETKFYSYKADRIFETKKYIPNDNMRRHKARA
jgi:hypothetical protein